jgi:transcriptional regulator with XRE-family HTH domain
MIIILENFHMQELTEDRKRLGEQLANARRRRGWTQTDVARRSTRQPGRLSEIENGKANVTVDTLAEAGEALGMALTFVPKERLADVLTFIGQSEPTKPLPTEVGSVYDEVFIADPPPEEERKHGGP